MKILLTGGGTGGHITPLLAVAHELKTLNPECSIYAVCEKNAKFKQLYEQESAISEVYEVAAGKYRRYAGLTALQKLLDLATVARNVRDIGRVTKGYVQARKLLKTLKPDVVLIKGGFVSVPVGLAAAQLKIPFITHDSDSIPGMANRIVARWAETHATGMPAELYAYDQARTVYTGVPVSSNYQTVSQETQLAYRQQLGLKDCHQVITVIGASQGASQLNQDVLSLAGRLMQAHPDLGIVHIAGPAHETQVQRAYKQELLADELKRVIVKGFVNDAYIYTGAADVVISRASATVTAELAIQGKAVILVPGQLAGDHQMKNAKALTDAGRARMAVYGDAEGLYSQIETLLGDAATRQQVANKLHEIAKPQAAKELAELTLNLAKRRAGEK